MGGAGWGGGVGDCCIHVHVLFDLVFFLLPRCTPGILAARDHIDRTTWHSQYVTGWCWAGAAAGAAAGAVAAVVHVCAVCLISSCSDFLEAHLVFWRLEITQTAHVAFSVLHYPVLGSTTQFLEAPPAPPAPPCGRTYKISLLTLHSRRQYY